MKIRATLAVSAAAFGLILSGCSSSDSGSSTASESPSAAASAGKVGVILPDSASSARWETADRKFLEEAFQAAGVEYDIQNAQGDKAKFQTIADQMLNAGANVLMIVNLDSDTGAAVIKKANAQGVKVIDYDRLTLNGDAAYYVSFDNVAVGTKIGEGLVKCMQDNGDTTGPVALLNGSPTDTTRRCSSRATRRPSPRPATRSLPISLFLSGTTPRRAPSSSRCTRRPMATSSVWLLPTMVWAARRFPCSTATVRPARSRSLARTPPMRVSSACCWAPSA